MSDGEKSLLQQELEDKFKAFLSQNSGNESLSKGLADLVMNTLRRKDPIIKLGRPN